MLAGVLAEFLAAEAEAGERQSILPGYNTAVRAAEDLPWIGPVLQQIHKRIAHAVSQVGFQPYFPPEGCASKLRELRSILERRQWHVLRSSIGSFGLGLARSLAYALCLLLHYLVP